MALTKVKAGNILLTTPSASSNDVTPATTAYVTTALANLADSAPSTLDTLNELAAALGDDANFSTTVTNSIAAKLPLSGGTMTGALIGTSATFTPSSGENFVITRDSGGPYIGASSNHSLRIITNNTTRLTIDASGNVGINRTSITQHAADVNTFAIQSNKNGKAGAIQLFSANDSVSSVIHQDTAGLALITNSSTSGDRNDILFQTASSTKMKITEAGLVGIGEPSPSAPLDIAATSAGIELQTTDNTSYGYLNFGDPQDNNIGQILYDHGSNYMRFQVNNTEKMRIHSNGGISLTGNHQFNFRATGLSNSGLGAVMVFDTVASGNAAGCYSTSSGMYQAAIDGWYMVSVGIRYDSITGSSSSYARPQLRYLADGGSTWLYPHTGFWVDPIIGTDFGTGSYMNCTYSVPMYLEDGDNIQLIEQGASATITHNHDESHFGVIFMG